MAAVAPTPGAVPSGPQGSPQATTIPIGAPPAPERAAVDSTIYFKRFPRQDARPISILRASKSEKRAASSPRSRDPAFPPN